MTSQGLSSLGLHMNTGTARKSRNGQDVQTYFSPWTVSSTCLNILQFFSLCRPTDLGQAVWRQSCPVHQLVKSYVRYNVLEICNYESVKVESSMMGYLYYYLTLYISLLLLYIPFFIVLKRPVLQPN